MYFLIRYLLSYKSHWLLAFGAACGLGILSKYTVLFFLSGLLLALVFSPHRKLFLTKHIWLAAGIALLMVLPNFWWQYEHRFPVVAHMQELRRTQLVYIKPVDFIVEQIILFLPVMFLWISGLIYVLRKPQWRFLFIYFFLVWLLLIAGSGKGYYAMAIYPVPLVFGSLAVGRWMARTRSALRWFPLATAMALGVLFSTIGLPFLPPENLAAFYRQVGLTKTPLLKWEDQQQHPLPQDFADMQGWKEIAAMTKRAYAALPDSVQNETIIYCRGYFTAGCINYYGPELGLPEAMSDNGSYLQWIPDSIPFRHLLLIGHNMPDPDDEVFNHFAERRVVDSLQLPLARENGIKVMFFHQADSLLPYFVQRSLQEQRNRFRR
jgi:4-amino-4-deoxy-L-arabinose transferase-like glycosyltransferase